MSSFIATLAIAALSLQPVSASISACPSTERTWTCDNGPTYRICSNTDYKFGGRSLQLVRDVQSTDDCAKICSNDTRCQKAVYDKKGKICHVKDANSRTRMPWEIDTNFDTIRIETTELAEGAWKIRAMRQARALLTIYRCILGPVSIPSNRVPDFAGFDIQRLSGDRLRWCKCKDRQERDYCQCMRRPLRYHERM